MSPEIRPLGETLNNREKWLLLGSLIIALFVGALDQTVVSTAQAAILSDLNGFSLLSWMFTSYMLASTVVIPLVGKLSDTYGRKTFIIAGIVLFMVSSAACGAAPNMPTFIIVRAIQGVGGGMIFASVFASIGDIFAPAERARYMGLFTGTFSLASIAGPTVGGFLTDSLSWRWVFYINIPFSLVAIPAIWINLPLRRGARKPKVDYFGALLLSVASVLLLLALVWAGSKYAWGSLEIMGLIASSAALLLAFIWQESRHPDPMVPLHLFRNGVFVLANLILFAFGIGMFGVLAYLPIFVQTALGASATASGVITTPQSLGMLVASIAGGNIVAWKGRYKAVTVTGAVIVVVCMAALSRLGLDTPKVQISLTMVVLGFGFGLLMPTMSLVIQNAVDYRFLGVASSAGQFFRQMGTVLGTAVFGTILATTYHGAFTDKLPEADRTALPAAVVEAFQDPTLVRDKHAMQQLTEPVITASPTEGPRLIASAKNALREAMVVAIRRIFLAAVLVSIATLLFTIFLKELPLRRDFKAVQPTEGGGEVMEFEAPPAVGH